MKHTINMDDWRIWEQNASPMFLTMTLNAGMQPLREYFGMPLWTSVIVFEENQGRWLFRPAELKLLGQKMIDYLMCPPYRVAFETGYETSEKKVRQGAHEIQFSEDLVNLTSENLVNKFETFSSIYYSWYRYGWFVEPIQFRGQDILTAYLEKEVKIKQPQLDLADVRQAIYTIEEDTFAVEIIQHLLECAKRLAPVMRDNSLVVKEKDLRGAPDYAIKLPQIIFSFLETNHDHNAEELKNILEEHSTKYYWKQNNYFSTKFFGPRDVLMEIVSSENFDVTNPASQFENEIARIRENKPKLLSKKSAVLEILPPYYRNLAIIMSSVGGVLLDKRKRTIMIANAAFDRILGVLASRTGTEIADCRLLIPQELRSFVLSPREYRDRFQERKGQFLVTQGDFPLNDELIGDVMAKSHDFDLNFDGLAMKEPFIAEGSQVEKVLDLLSSRLNLFSDITLSFSELQGVTTYYDTTEPIITGIVAVVKNPKTETIKKGEILVAPSTTPDYMDAIRRCKAIITDWGGQTSHAAITSRELKKPCIIGTNFASQVLKTGDKVQLNLKQGTIELLK